MQKKVLVKKPSLENNSESPVKLEEPQIVEQKSEERVIEEVGSPNKVNEETKTE